MVNGGARKPDNSGRSWDAAFIRMSEYIVMIC